MRYCMVTTGKSGPPLSYRRPAGPFSGRQRTVVSPTDERLSFSVWDAGGRLVVQSPQLLGCFDSPRRDNVLFWRSPPQGAWLLLTPAGQRPLWYHQMRPAELDERFGPSLATRRGPLGQCFFRQADEGPPIYQVVPIEAAGAALERPADGYLNPLVLRLPMDGTELGLAAFREAAGDVLCCEPVVGPEDDLPHQLLASVADRARCRGGLLSPVETVLLGLDLRAARALDRLGGTFLVEGPDAEGARYLWAAPRRLSANAAWLADYWLERWGGRRAESVQAAVPVRQPPPARVGRSAPGDWSAEVAAGELPALTESACACLSRLRPAHAGPAMLAALQLLGPRAARAGDVGHCHRAALSVEPLAPERCRVSLCPSALLAALAARVLPRSQVRLVLPAHAPLIARASDRAALAEAHARACGPRFVDLLTARPLQRLFAALAGPPLPAATLQVPYRFAWREEWLASLFFAARGSRLSFVVPGGGFVLGRSRLGTGRFGGRAAVSFALSF